MLLPADHFRPDHFAGKRFFSFSGFSRRSFQRSFCSIFFRLSSNHFGRNLSSPGGRSFSGDHFSKCCVSATGSLFCYVKYSDLSFHYCHTTIVSWNPVNGPGGVASCHNQHTHTPVLVSGAPAPTPLAISRLVIATWYWVCTFHSEICQTIQWVRSKRQISFVRLHTVLDSNPQ